MKLTSSHIHECSTPRGGWNKAQLAVLGITWPPERGWISRLEGSEVEDKTYEEFKRLATLKVKMQRPVVSTDPVEQNKIDPADKNVAAVRAKLESRMLTGFKKYGVTTERTDLNRKQWLIHAQEEAMDLAVYLERLIQEES